MKNRFYYYMCATVLFILASIILIVTYQVLATAHLNPKLWSGWLVFSIVIFLALYNLRKKLSVPQLISSKIWLKLHVAIALIGIVVFFLHVGPHLPRGFIEQLLATLWCVTTLSGILGLFFTRILPARLTAIGEEVIFEAIPEHRRQLLISVETLAQNSIAETQFTTVAYFFADTLRNFFTTPKNTLQHIIGKSSAIEYLLRDIQTKKQYLNDEEIDVLTKIGEYAIQKDKLDYHYALQLTLKLWLFVHIPFTYALITTAILHIILVFAFAGGTL